MAHRYLIQYIERGGDFAKKYVFAHNKAAARRAAEEEGCEDIFRVRRVGFFGALFFVTLIVIVLVLVIVFCR